MNRLVDNEENPADDEKNGPDDKQDIFHFFPSWIVIIPQHAPPPGLAARFPSFRASSI